MVQNSPPSLGNDTDNGLGEILSYISRLGLDDIDSFQARASNSSGSSQSTPSDEELAMLMFVQEAESLLNVTKDFITGSSAPSRSLLEELVEMEEMARYDHEVALAISEGRPIPPRPQPRASTSSSVSILPELPAISEDDSDADTFTSRLNFIETLSDSASESGDPEPDVSCTLCGESVEGPIIHAPCGHAYGVDCLQLMFRKAATDESVFPPSCCVTPLRLADVRQHLDRDLVELFEKKAREFTTVHRVYCFQLACSAFIGAATNTPSSLRCSECLSRTCGSCKEEAHIGRACSAHLDQAVLDMAKQEKWQRCYSCHHLVELTQGCYHMVCICKAQFCYHCGKGPWKQCTCPQFAVPDD